LRSLKKSEEPNSLNRCRWKNSNFLKGLFHVWKK
jgi:hypothetical protein